MKKHFVVLLIKAKKLFLVMACWVVSQCSTLAVFPVQRPHNSSAFQSD